MLGIGKDKPVWRSVHVANVSILSPAHNPSGRWLLYCRGSGRNVDGYHDSIGLFEQDPATFNPSGPWREYPANPVLTYGERGSHDEKHLLDTAATQGRDSQVLAYYKSKDNQGNMGLCVAVSEDGCVFTKQAAPILHRTGICDMVFHKDKYHLFRGEMIELDRREKPKWILRVVMNVSGTFDQFPDAPERIAIDVGAPGTFDGRCVYGAKIFKVTGDPRWFMIYQTGGRHIDYPDRFHAAYSDDLLCWTRVQNLRPLMTRGMPEQWDQGGIWTGSVIEHADRIHIFYEGWGKPGPVQDRDELYFQGGNSRVGVASASVVEFLQWVDGVN